MVKRQNGNTCIGRAIGRLNGHVLGTQNGHIGFGRENPCIGMETK